MESTPEEEFGSTPGGVAISGGWMEYFPGVPYCGGDSRAVLLETLTHSLQQPLGDDLLSKIRRDGSTCHLAVNVDFLVQASVLPECFPVALAENPQDAIACLGAAAYNTSFGLESHRSVHSRRIHVRIFNFAASRLPLKRLRADALRKLVSVRGTVVRMSDVQPLVLSMIFSCCKCGVRRQYAFKDGIYSPPTKCPDTNCGHGKFTPYRNKAKLIDLQTIRIQEILRPDEHEDGRMPRTVACELRRDLVDACLTADVVTVCGFVKSMATGSDSKNAKENKGFYDLYIEALSIVNSKDANKQIDEEWEGGGGRQNSAGPLNAPAFSPLDLEFVATFATESGPDLFRNIVHSICPGIFGHAVVKAGIALVLFGGVQMHAEKMDNEKVPVRGDIHMLIVGDPGLGKSQLLKAASNVAGRGVYVCGNGTTNAGLTAAVVKDPRTGEYALEPGAVVVANGGLCCIDEFEKLSAKHQALLEPMEQQCVSIAKAGLVATMSAQTSILAAANPVGRGFDRSKTVHENLQISAPLLSRFDLVFILVDKPDERKDHRVAEHVLALHRHSEDRPEPARAAFFEGGGSSQLRMGRIPSLTKKLKLDRGAEEFEPLPPQLLRKYIRYAREYVFPRLTEEAASALKEFYLWLRSSCEGTPITTRSLESLIRLAQARAKLELREEVTKQDALDVIDVMKESLFDMLVDEHGRLDFGRSGGLSHGDECKRFLRALQQRCDIKHDRLISTSDLYSLADEVQLRVKNLEAFIGNLNLAGYILKKGHNMYQVQGSS